MIPDSTISGQTSENATRCGGEDPATRVLEQDRGQHRVVRIVATLALVVAATYVLYQRIGTTAQADLVEFTPNLAGGFLAIGMMDDHPGFVVLSALDREAVDVRADRYTNAVAGNFTVAEVRTPQTKWHRRLRTPMIVLVDDSGSAESFPVDWSLAEFVLIRDGADCGHSDHGTRHRCGAPFADLFDIVSDERLSPVPAAVRRFLAPFARSRGERVDRPNSNVNLPVATVVPGG